MSYSEVFTCDECGAKRGESNHWFVAVQHTVRREVQSIEEMLVVSVGVRSVEFYRWDHEAAANAGASHICGSECCQKFLAKWMSTERTEEQGS